MEKDWNVALLLDLYGNALTSKQADAVDLYYNQDLSLAEIAQELEISRQGVFDLIRRGVAHLKKQDETFGLLERMRRRSEELRRVRAVLQRVEEQAGDVCREEFSEIYRILDRMTD